MASAISAVMLSAWRKVNDAIGIPFDDIPSDHLTPVLEELRISKQITAIEAVQAAACFKKLSELSPAQRKVVLSSAISLPPQPSPKFVQPPVQPPVHAPSPLASFSDYDTQRSVWSAPVDSSTSWPSEPDSHGFLAKYQQFHSPASLVESQYGEDELALRPKPLPVSYSASVGAAAVPPIPNMAGSVSSLPAAPKPADEKKTNGAAKAGPAPDSDRSQPDRDAAAKPPPSAPGIKAPAPADKRPMCSKHCLCKDGLDCPKLHSLAEQRIFKIMSKTNPKVKTKLCFSYADGKRCYFHKTPEDCFGAHGPKDGWCAFCGACGHFVPECPLKHA